MIAAFCNPTLALSLSALTARSLMLYDIRRLTYPGARNHGSSRDALASNITMNAVQRSHARRPISTNLAQSLCLARRKCDAYILLYSLSWIATRDFVMNSVLSFSLVSPPAHAPPKRYIIYYVTAGAAIRSPPSNTKTK